LKLNLSDKQARIALQQDPPDRDKAYQGMLGGGNHPDDIGGMIRLFIWFENIYPMKPAIETWEKGDRTLEQLQQLANRVHIAVKSGQQSNFVDFMSELEHLHDTMNTLEVQFSSELSHAARWMKGIFLIVNISVLLAALIVISLIARKVISEVDEAEKELRVSESRFKTLYNSNIIGILLWGKDGELYDANEESLNILGYDRSELESGKLNWKEITPEESKAADAKAMKQIAEMGYCTPFNKEYIHKDGHRVPIFLGCALINGFNDKGIAFLVDRSNEKKMEDQLRLSATVLEASRDGILIFDQDRRVLTANDAFYEMSGKNDQSVIGLPAKLVYSAENEDEKDIDDALDQKGYWQGDSQLQLEQGGELPVRTSVSVVTSEEGSLTYYVAVYTDISVRKALERDLKVMAHYDHLTGLANRSLYSDRLDTAVIRAQRHQQQCAILFMDLDKFKGVNDEYGHEVGDLLLQEVAKRLLRVSRKSDTVGRLGGDEFIVIIEDLIEANTVVQVAEKISEQLHMPFDIAGREISIGCSIGIAIYPDHGDTGAELTRSADIAMYAAKVRGDTHYYVYRDNTG